MLAMLSFPSRFISIAGLKMKRMRKRAIIQTAKPKSMSGKLHRTIRKMPMLYLKGVRKVMTLTGMKGTGSSSRPSERRMMPSHILQLKRNWMIKPSSIRP